MTDTEQKAGEKVLKEFRGDKNLCPECGAELLMKVSSTTTGWVKLDKEGDPDWDTLTTSESESEEETIHCTHCGYETEGV